MALYSILYVDDEPDLLVLGKTFLEAIGDFAIDTRQSAPEGLDALRTRSYDVIISDFQMPDMDGLAFLKAVRSEFGNLPFILFTGRGREDVVIEAINSGVDFYLQKGGDAKAQFAELAHKIRMAVEREQAVAERIESEKRLSAIFHASPIHQMITEYDTDRIIDINDRFLKDLRQSRNAIIGRTIHEIDLMPDPVRMAKLKQELAVSGVVRNVPVTVRGSTGTVYTSLTSMTRVQVHGKDLIYTQSVDITPLKKAQQTINALLNATRDVSLLLDCNGTILAANHAASVRYHIPLPDLIGQDAYTLISADYAPRRQKGVEEVIRTRQPLTYTDTRDGRVYENTLCPVLDADAMVSAVAVYSHDASDEVAAKRALAESEEKYRLVVENSHDTIYIYRGDTFLFINRQAEDLTGYTHEELMQRDIWDFLHPDDRDRLKQRALQRFAGGVISSGFEARILRKDGSVRDGQFYVDLVTFQGRPAILGIARDITEQKRAEEAIREREQQLRSLSDNLPNGMIYQLVVEPDKDRHFIHVSAGVEGIHGVTAEDVLRDSSVLYSQVHPDDRNAFIEAEEQALASMSPFSFEIRVRPPSGTERWVLLRSAPRPLPGGGVLWDGIELDITATKRAEEELKAAYEQLAASQEELQGQFDALRDGQAQLEESEDKYRTLVEHTDDGVFVAQDRNLIFVNEALAGQVGYRASDLVGHPFADVIAPEDRDLVLSRHVRRLSGETLPDDYEFSLIHRDGITRSRVRIRVGTGRFHGKPAVIGTLHNVTEERKREAALAESEARFRSLTEQSLDTIMLFDRNLRHIYVNPMAEKIAGIPAREFIGKTHSELHFPLQLAAIREDALREVFTTGKTRRVEFLLPASGIWVDWMLVPVTGPDNTVTEVITSARDITERKKAEEALRESEKKYRDLVQNANSIILKWDTSGNITFFNEYAQRFFGYTEEEILGKSVVGTIVPATESRSGRDLRCMVEEIIKNPSDHLHNENENITRDGRRVWIRWENRPLFDKNGKFIGQLCIGSDNTERKMAETALAKSEELHRKMIATIPDLVVRTDLDGTILFVNENTLKLGGYKDPAEITGTSVLSFFAPECRALAEENTRLMFERPLGPKEYVFVTKDKTRITLEVNGDVLRTPDGVPYGMIFICRDITSRQRDAEALRQSEELYRSLVTTSPDGIAMIDSNGKLTYASPRALEMFGLTDQNEVTGTHVTDWIAEPDRNKVMQCFRELMERPVLSNHVYRMMRKDGSCMDVEMHSAALHDGKGSVRGIISILRDITERRKAEDALRESEENYRRIIENMQDVFYRTDKDGILTMLSTYGAYLMGYGSADEVIGKMPATAFYADPAERDAFMGILGEKGVVSGYPLTLKSRDGKLHAATASSRIIYDKSGNMAGVEGILHDVTRMRDVENALRQANRQITLMTSITRHDIRNQLLALNGWLELSRASVDDPERMLELISRKQKIASVIGEQLDFTTFFDGMGIKAPAWQDVEAIVRQSALALPFTTTQLDIRVHGIGIFADPLLEKAFYNLLDNALRYGGEKMTSIQVSSRYDGDTLILVVEDDGVGIKDSDRQQLFTRGYGENTGLGLFLVREILAITGITIHETGSSGCGARFEIQVPAGKYRTTVNGSLGQDPDRT